MFYKICLIFLLPYFIESHQGSFKKSARIYNQYKIEKNYNQPCNFNVVQNCFEKFNKYSNQTYSIGILSQKEGLDDICNITKQTFNCLVDRLNHCGPPLQREIVKNIITELSRTLVKFCEPGKLREEFTKHASCIIDDVLNTANYREKCYFPFLKSIGEVFVSKTMDTRLEVACCAYNKWQSCMYGKVTDKCKEDGKNAMIYFTEKIFGEAPNRVCPINEFDNQGPKCINSIETTGIIGFESTLLPVAKYISTQLIPLIS